MDYQNLADAYLHYFPYHEGPQREFFRTPSEISPLVFCRDGALRLKSLQPDSKHWLLPGQDYQIVQKPGLKTSNKVILFACFNRQQHSWTETLKTLKYFSGTIKKYKNVSLFIQFDQMADSFNSSQCVTNLLEISSQMIPQRKILSLAEFSHLYYQKTDYNFCDLTHNQSYYDSYLLDHLLKKGVRVLNFAEAKETHCPLSENHGIRFEIS